MRIGPNLGRKFSKRWIDRLSESHKKYFAENPLARKRNSDRLLKLWRTPSYRAKQMKARGGRTYRLVMARYWHLYEPKHHRANIVGYVPEHVVLVEKKIGRKIKKSECVHHLDGNRLNNHIDNLVLVTKSQHSSIHAKETGFGVKTRTDGKYHPRWYPRKK